jgi:carboxylate-amine ligase
MENLVFKENTQAFTLGTELELQLIDRKSLQLTPAAPALLEALNHPQLTRELFQSMLEVVSGVCSNAREARADIEKSLHSIEAYTGKNNLFLSSTGNHPGADYNDRIVTDSPRYHYLIDRNKWLTRRTAVFGLHVHIGMRNGDECIAFANFMLRQLPMLIALSASSPFWRGHDTGLATSRPTVYEAIPTCGLPYLAKDWEEFALRYHQLIHVKSIESMKDLWWDLRPSPGYGTLEIRICDGPATLAEMEALIAFLHLLALWYNDNRATFDAQHPVIPERWILRENKWRSVRHGLEALFVEEHSISNIPLRDYIRRWLEELKPYAETLDYGASLEWLERILQNGNSSDRQRRIWQESGDLNAVIRHNIDEYYLREPIWS